MRSGLLVCFLMLASCTDWDALGCDAGVNRFCHGQGGGSAGGGSGGNGGGSGGGTAGGGVAGAGGGVAGGATAGGSSAGGGSAGGAAIDAGLPPECPGVAFAPDGGLIKISPMALRGSASGVVLTITGVTVDGQSLIKVDGRDCILGTPGTVTTCTAPPGDGGFVSAPVFIDDTFAGCVSYIGEPIAWYVADDAGLVRDGGDVLGWRDRSARGNDLVVETPGYNPTLGRLGNDMPGVHFANTGSNLAYGLTAANGTTAGLPLGAAPRSLFAVTTFDNLTKNHSVVSWGRNVANQRFAFVAGPSGRAAVNVLSGALVPPQILDAGQTYVLGVTYDAGNLDTSVVSFDGQPVIPMLAANTATPPATSVAGGGPLCVGKLSDVNSQSEGLAGTIGEVIIYNRGLNDAQRRVVDSYLVTKFDAAPVVVSVEPFGALSTGGSTLTLHGYNFHADTEVLVGGQPCTVQTVQADRVLTCTMPPAASAATIGLADVVTNGPTSGPVTLRNAVFYVGDPVAWFDAELPTSFTLNGNGVTTWRDRSAKRNDVTAVDMSALPRWVPGAFGGRAAVRFSNVAGPESSLQKADAGSLPQFGADRSLFAAASFTDPARLERVISYGSPDAGAVGARFGFMLDQRGTVGVDIGNASLQSDVASAITADRPAVIGYTYATGTFITAHTLTLNGAAVTAQDTMDAGTTQVRTNGNVLRVGNAPGGTANEAHSGDIAEILLYGRTLSATERAAVEQYLMKKYGVVP